MKIKLTNVRLSFADLFLAISKFDGDPKYSASFIIDPSTDDGKANLAAFKKAVRAIEADKFNGDEMPTSHLPIQDGNDKGYDGWTDNIIISAANKKRPVIVGRQRQPVAEGDLDTPQSGDYVNCVIDLWGMNNNYGKRIIASLEGVQYAAKGESFSASSVNVESDFDVISGDSATVAEVKEAFGI
tara:strand:- start:443 stop:997 length:555 start_codon:yes stop_codon:yes gene_type:complete